MSKTEERLALSAAQNTKVETLADAIESLVMGVASSIISKTEGKAPSDIAAKFMVDARFNVRVALRDFLIPALRLVEPRQPYTNDTESIGFINKDERVKCGECNRHFICADTRCPHWHKAVRQTINPATPDVPGGNAA